MYYSDVYFVCKREVYNKILEEIEKLPNSNDIKGLWLNIEKQNEDSVFIQHKEIKWYLDYDDVKYFEETIEKLDDDDYKFIKIGTDYDDIVYEGEYYKGVVDMYPYSSVDITERD